MLNLPIKILQTQQIETAQATVEFTGIDTLVAQWDAAKKVTSRHLVLIVNAKSDAGAGHQLLRLRFNGDAGANYHWENFYGAGAAASGGIDTQVSLVIGRIAGNVANTFGGGLCLIPHAFNTSNHKAMLGLAGGVELVVEMRAGRWASTAAITSILVFTEGNFMAGSTIHLGVIDERYLVEEIAGAGDAIFSDIPQGEGDLAIIGYCRGNRALTRDSVDLFVNDDLVAANYWTQLLTYWVAAGSSGAANDSSFGIVTAANATANAFGALALTFPQYTKDNMPHYLALSGFHSTVGPDAMVRAASGRRVNIEPINKIQLTATVGTFVAGSFFSLYRVPKRIIDRQELTAPQATITFDNIPQNFEALMLHVYARSSEAAVADEIAITINDDAVAANYDWQELEGTGAGPPTATQNLASQQLLYIPADNEGAREFGGGNVLIPSYAETDRHKHLVAIHGRQENQVIISSYRWENTDAIVKIVLAPVGGPNFMAGTVVELEGILRKEGLPPDEGMLWGV